MTETQAWFLLVEGGIVALYFLLALFGIRRGP
jgi:hypothetical protein